MSAAGRGAVVLRSLLWLVLGSWVGAWLCFALVVAPAAFRVLPSTEVAGVLVSAVLPPLHLGAGAAGVVLAAIAALLRRGRLLVGLPLGLGAASLANEWVVSARIVAVRPLAFGAEGNAEAVAAFRRLHEISVIVFGAVLLGAIVLIVLHARCDASAARRSP